jgi:hypothetical protein
MAINGEAEIDALSKHELGQKNERLYHYLNAVRDINGNVGNIGKLFHRMGKSRMVSTEEEDDTKEENMKFDSANYKRLVKNGRFRLKSNRF